MAAPILTPAYDYFLDFVMEKTSAQEILAFQLPEEAQQRAVELLDKQDRDELTDAEELEMEQMAQIERLVMALKARADGSSA
jgi:uncharacterized protein YciU (UPF0263 family)